VGGDARVVTGVDMVTVLAAAAAKRRTRWEDRGCGGTLYQRGHSSTLGWRGCNSALGHGSGS